MAQVVNKTARVSAVDGNSLLRDADLATALDTIVPDGFDLYFDNVGGPILDQALRRMKVGGRVIQCGTASIDRWSPPPTGPRHEREVLTRRLTWQGFVIFDHQAEFPGRDLATPGSGSGGQPPL